MSQITVYLAGGMVGDWQKRVMEAVPGLNYINPQDHKLPSPDDYTTWDLLGIKRADLVFAYLSLSNPSGIGLALEVGYAKGLGKTVIFVDEKGFYTHIVRSAADTWTDNFENGLRILKSLTFMERIR